MAEPNPRWRLHTTPNPAEKSFSVIVPMVEIANNIGLFDAYPEGSEFKDFPLIPDEDLASEDKFGLYIFRECTEVGISMEYLFVRTKTPLQRNTPFRKKRISQKMEWDAELRWIEFGQNTGFPLSQNTINGQGQPAIVTAPRWLVPRGYRNSQVLMTVIDIQEFLSEVMWPEYLMESDEPQPTEVMWDLTGSHGTMGKCLHDTVPVPSEDSSSYKVVTSVGDVQSANATGSKRWIFPKTNHKRRRDYEVISVEYVLGQYLLTKYLFHVPNPSKLIQQS
jgi:hypothetical protein